jgi:hypothetical protein
MDSPIVLNCYQLTENARHAGVAKLADALDLGSSSRKGVEVQVLSSAPKKTKHLNRFSIGFGEDPSGTHFF